MNASQLGCLVRSLTVAAFTVAICTPAIAQQHGNIMNRSATPEDWVHVLQTNPMGQTRSIVIDAKSTKPQDAPSAQALITFEFDSATLTPEAKQQLQSLAKALSSDALRNNQFRIEGHTDAVGSDAYNLELSARRARTVAQYLQQAGSLNEGKLQAVGKGKSDLYDKSHPKAAINRRVVITNIGQ
jgi:outer membrane protein OmpA-like peptidoglycan-associated protein